MSDDSFDDDIAFDDEALQQIDILTRSPSLSQSRNARSNCIVRSPSVRSNLHAYAGTRSTVNPVAGTSKWSRTTVDQRHNANGNRVSHGNGCGGADVVELSSGEEYGCDLDVSMETLE